LVLTRVLDFKIVSVLLRWLAQIKSITVEHHLCLVMLGIWYTKEY
jgi:hypothetical protein